VTVPVRETLLVFGVANKETVPLPVPVAPAVTVNHDAFVLDVHGHPAEIVTLTTPVPPSAIARRPEGCTVAEHEVAAACVTVNGCPAIVNVPLREVDDVFASAVNVTTPAPLPLAPAVTVSHGVALVAVHVQPGSAVTETLPLPPAAAIA
jgi:hypothetical protein